MFSDFPRALLAVAAVTTFGAKKYTPRGWVSVPSADERYDDAKGRHLLKGYIEPEDPESQLQHLAHEAWNALAVLELHLRKKERADWDEEAFRSLRRSPSIPTSQITALDDWVTALSEGRGHSG